MNKILSLKGYRMPGEWELQKSVWIAWPYNKKDWPNLFKNIPRVVAEIVANLSNSQKVILLINHHYLFYYCHHYSDSLRTHCFLYHHYYQ